MWSTTIDHNFETGHRLPQLDGKCKSLHGHSWRVRVTVAGDTLAADDTLIEFGAFKHVVRSWLDANLDHGLILGENDFLAPVLGPHGKVYVVEGWPTVERIAELIGLQVRSLLDEHSLDSLCSVASVELAETATNTVTWTPPFMGAHREASADA